MRKRFVVGLAVLAGLYLLGSAGKEEQRTPPSSPAVSYQPSQDIGQPSVATVPVKLEVSPPAVIDPSARSRNATQPRPAFVRGKAVALRSGPGKTFSVLDRYDAGREVDVIDADGEWAKVKDRLTQREGWVFASLLSDTPLEKPQADPEATREKKVAPKVAPDLSDSLIVQRLIAASIANYPGNCPCPENRDRAGRRCGKRSAWAKGGGYAPLCYASDITPAMIAAFRGR